MNEVFIYILLGLSGMGLGFLIAGLKYKSRLGRLSERIDQTVKNETYLNQNLKQVEEERDAFRREKEELNLKWVRLQTEYINLGQELEREKERFISFEKDFNDKFENLAHKIMLSKTQKFTDLNKENIENILKPLNDKIVEFQNQIGKTNHDFIKGHAELGKQLQLLNEQNIRISEEANNLTKALKGDSKMQGNWGELILEKILEKSNLSRDREYFVQPTFTDEEGNKHIPDIVLHLPNDKRMIIDSKVSLRAYERYVNEEDENAKQNFLKAHIKALNEHISQLSAKKYEDLLLGQSPDFVLMFVPIEPALYLAQNHDNSFFYAAFQRNILLVSPTTLLSTLRTIDALWSNEKQQQNAMEIAKHATSLYHKFKTLIDDLEVVGNRIRSTEKAYDKAFRKLTGNQNLIKDIQKLEELGVSPKDRISQKYLESSVEEEVSTEE